MKIETGASCLEQVRVGHTFYIGPDLYMRGELPSVPRNYIPCVNLATGGIILYFTTQPVHPVECVVRTY